MKAERPLPRFDIVGPTVDDDIRRLVWRYGAETVRATIKRQTARPRGRISENDWPELHRVLREDARVWLERGDPFKARSNRSIARDFAKKHPGHSCDATRDRIMRKLRERRRYYTLVEAEWISQTRYPFSENLRAIKELLEIGIRRELWQQLLWHNEGSLADYESKFGEPAASMTMQEVLTAAAQPIATTAKGSRNVLQMLRAEPSR